MDARKAKDAKLLRRVPRWRHRAGHPWAPTGHVVVTGGDDGDHDDQDTNVGDTEKDNNTPANQLIFWPLSRWTFFVILISEPIPPLLGAGASGHLLVPSREGDTPSHQKPHPPPPFSVPHTT